MSQATLLGLCSDNVVTVLTPSSTIECAPGSGSCGSCGSSGSEMKVVDVHSETVTVPDISDSIVILPLVLPTQATYAITGSLQIDFIIVPLSWSTSPPLNIYLQIDLDNPINRIKRTVTFRYVDNVYIVDPIDLQFSFLIKDKAATTITVTPMNAGGSVTFQGSLWYQYVQYTSC